MPHPTLTLGQPTAGSLDAIAEIDIHEVVLTAGVRYTIELLGAAGGSGLTLADPYVGLYDSTGTRLAANDDSGPIGNNSLIVFTPTQTGVYAIWAQASGSGGTGTYQVLVTGGSTSHPDDEFSADATTTGLAEVNGAAATGELQWAEDADWFRVAEMVAGTTYTIELKGAATGSGTLADPVVFLHDANGERVASNDDAGEGSNALLVYTPTVTGTYFISARGYGSSGPGTYEVSIAGVAPVDDYAAAIAGAGQLLVDEPTRGVLEAPRDDDWFAVLLAPGTTYTIEVKGSATDSGTLADPRVILYDANGQQLASNDDSGVGPNALLTFTTTASTEETYYVSARAYLDRGTGDYQVLVTAADVPDAQDDVGASADSAGQVNVNSSTRGELEAPLDDDWFAVRLGPGTTYTIEVKGAATGAGTLADPKVYLYAADGRQLAFNDDGGGVRPDARITYTTTASTEETYYISTRSSISGGTGEYEVSVATVTGGALQDDYPAGSPGSIEVGTPEEGAIEALRDTDHFTIRLYGGITYTIELKGAASASGSLADPIVRLFSGERQIASNDDSPTSTDSLLVYTPTVDGDYILEAAAWGGRGTGDYQLVVTPGGGAVPGSDDHPAGPQGAETIEAGQAEGGTLETLRDEDWFAVRLAPGTKYTVEVKGSATASGSLADPFVVLYDANGERIAYNDDGGVGANALLTFVPTATTEETYYISAGSYFGRGTGDYEVLVTALTGEAGITDDHSATDPGFVEPGGESVDGHIESARDTDRFSVYLMGGTTYTIEVKGAGSASGTLADPYLRVLSGNTQLASNDDGGAGSDSLLLFTPTANGEYFVEASAWGGRGTGNYLVVVDTADADSGTDDHGASPSKASALVVDTSQTGKLETEADADWFGVTLRPGTTYRIDLMGADSGGGRTLADPTVVLHDSQGLRIASNDDAGTGKDALLFYTPTQEGTFYVSARAFGDGGTGTYRISVTAVPPGGGSGAPAEEEPGAGLPPDLSGAEPLVVDELMLGTLASTVVADWYAIELEAGVAYTIMVAGASSAAGTLIDPRVFLHDAQGEFLSSNDDGGAGLDAMLRYMPETSGTYYISTRAFGSGEGSYKLKVVTGVPGEGPGPNGPDDVLGDATTAGRAQVGGIMQGRLETAGDRDWFSLSLTAGTTYRILLNGDASGSGSLVDPLLRVHRGNETQAAINDDGGFEKDSAITFTPSSTGIHFLSAGAFNDTGTGTYELKIGAITASGANPGDDWDSSPTGFVGALEPGGVGNGVIEVLGDVDWFRISLTAGTEYFFKLQGAPTGLGTLADPYITIMDPTGKLLASDDDAGAGRNSLLRFVPTATGVYYVGAQGFGGAGSYVVMASSHPEDGDDYAADTSDAAGRIADNQTRTGTVETSGDADWFRIELTAGTTYTISLNGADSGSGSLADPFLRIYGLDGGVPVLLASDTASSGWGTNDQLKFTPEETGVYYLSASAVTGERGSYSLHVTSTDDFPADRSTVGGFTAPVHHVNRVVDTGVLEATNDRDWFRVLLTAGQVYTFKASGASSGSGTLADPSIAVHGPGGRVVVAFQDDDSGPGTDDWATFTATTSGYYYLSAGSGAGSTGSYTVSGYQGDDYASPFGAGAPPRGSLAPNQTITGNIETAGDRDLFVATIVQNTRYWVSVKGRSSEAGTLVDPYVARYTAEDLTLTSPWEQNDNASGGTLDAFITILPVGVSSQDIMFDVRSSIPGGTGTYDITFIKDDWGQGTVQQGNVPVIVDGESIQGHIDVSQDQDWVRVYLHPGRSYQFHVEGVAGESQNPLAQPVLQLFDINGNLLKQEAGGSGVDLTYAHSSQDGQYESGAYYYIGVSGGGGTGRYEVSFDSYDPDRGVETPLVLVNGRGSGSMQYRGDEDWFKVWLDEDVVYSLWGDGNATGHGSIISPYLYLYDSAGTLLASDLGGGVFIPSREGDNAHFTYVPDSSGYYFVSMGPTTSLGTYQILVTSNDDQRGDSATLGSIESNTPIVGAIEAAGDVDWYKVRLTQNEPVYAIWADGLRTGFGTLFQPVVKLYDVWGNLIATLDGSGDLDNTVAMTLSRLDGDYFVSVSSASDATGTYRLHVRANDDYQQDRATTGTLEFGGVRQGDATYLDRDWYRVSLQPNQEYWFWLDGEATNHGTLDRGSLALYDAEGNLLAQQDGGGAIVGNLENGLLKYTTSDQGGIYYIQAAGSGPYWGTYTLSLSAGGDLRADRGTLGELELFRPGGSDLYAANDVDWFRIRLSRNSDYTIWVDGEETAEGATHAAVRLYDSLGQPVGAAGSGVGEHGWLDVRTGADEIYYVAISSRDGSAGAYQVLASLRDDYQANTNTLGVLTSAAPATGRIDSGPHVPIPWTPLPDSDWFRVHLDAQTHYTFIGNGLFNGQLDLYAEDGVTLVASQFSDNGAAPRLVFEAEAAGDYFIAASAADVSGYAISLVARSTIAANEVLQGSLGAAGEVDRHRVWLDGSSYWFWMDGASSGSGSLPDPTVNLYRETGQLVGTFDGGGFGTNVAFRTAGGSQFQAGYYFVDLYSATGGTGSYTFHVSNRDDIQGSRATIAGLSDGVVSSGNIEHPGDTDWFRVSLEAGDVYDLRVLGTGQDPGRTLANPTYALRDSNGDLIAGQVDVLRPTVSGDYYVEVRSADGMTGTYGVVIEERIFVQDMGELWGGVGSGNLEFETSVDRFHMEMPAGHRIVFRVEGSSTGRGTLANPTLRLIDPAGNLVAVVEDGGAGGNVYWFWSGTQTGGIYTLEVFSSDDSTGTYAISVEATLDDVYPNNVDTEGIIQVDAPVADYALTYADSDWFRVSMTQGVPYQLTLQSGTFQGTPYNLTWAVLSLYDESGEEVLAQGTTDSDNGTRTLHFTPTASGDYFLVASTQPGGVGGRYGISVSTPEDAPDATTSSQIVIPEGGTAEFGRSIQFAGDVDWFRLETQEGATYRVWLKGAAPGNTNTLAAPRLAVHDASGQEVGFDITPDADGSYVLEATSPLTGTFYIAASSRDGGTGTYTVYARVDDAGSDVTATSRLILDPLTEVRLDRNIEATGDTDWFRVDLSAHASYRFRLQGASSDAGSGNDNTLAQPTLTLYDASGQAVATQAIANDGDDTYVLDFVPAAGGTYFVAASSRNGGTGTYSVFGQVVDDVPYQTTSTPRVFEFGSEVEGWLERAGDSDWYRVSLNAGSPYAFQLDGSALAGASLSLYDRNGIEVATQTSPNLPGQGYQIMYTPTSGGDYYLAAASANGSTGSYTLHGSLPDETMASAIRFLNDGAVYGFTDIGENGDAVDWYRVRLPAESRQEFNFYSQLSGQTTVTLHNPDGSVIQTLLVAQDTLETLTFDPQPPGDYFIRVEPQDGHSGYYGFWMNEIDDILGYYIYTPTTIEVDTPSTWKLNYAGDSDTVRVWLDSSQVGYDITVEGEATGLFLTIYPPGGGYLGGFAAGPDGTVSAPLHGVIPPGYYFLDVYSVDASEGSYTINVKVNDEAAGPGTATQLPLAPITTSRLDRPLDPAGDVDWMWVDMVAGAEYRLVLQGATAATGTGNANTLAQPVVTVRDAAGNALASQAVANEGDDSYVLVYTPTQSGRYYVEAASRDGGAGTYSLFGSILDDAGQTTGTGHHIDISAGAVTGRLEESGDADWYRVSLTPDALYSFRLGGSEMGSASISLYDSNGALLGTQQTASATLPNSTYDLQSVVGTAGDYYIAVSSPGGSTGAYTVDAVLLDPLLQDTTATAVRMDVVQDLWANMYGPPLRSLGSGSDAADWFTVDLQAGSDYSIVVVPNVVSRGATLGDAAVTLYDDGGNVVAAQNGSNMWYYPSSYLYLTYSPLESGTFNYTVSPLGTQSGNYWTLVTKIDEHPSNVNTTARIEVGAPATAYPLNETTDVDWVRVRLQAGGVYTVTMIDDPYFEANFSLRGPSGEWIAANNSVGYTGTTVHSITYTAQVTGDYFLEASVSQTYSPRSWGNYTLSATLVTPPPPAGMLARQETATTLHLASYGVTVEAAHTWVLSHVAQPGTIFHVAQQFGLTNAMLAEIAGPGITADHVIGFFAGQGIDSKPLDGGGIGPIPAGLQALSNFLALDDSEARVEALRGEVIANTGSADYWKLFSANHVNGADDGALTPQELGSDRVGTIDTSAKTLEALFYGTMREVVEFIDDAELAAMRDWLATFAEELKGGDEAVTADYVALVADALADAAPVREEAQTRELLVDAATAAVQLLAAGGSADLLMPLLMG